MVKSDQDEAAPSWSPEGALVFQRSAGLGEDGVSQWRELFIIDPGESEPRQLTDRPFLDSFQPTWSPDGSVIAFVGTTEGGDVEIFTIEPDGDQLKQVTDTEFSARNPAWSPSGDKIAFDHATGDDLHIYLLDLEAGNVTDIVRGYNPEWSPDGKALVFSRLRPGGTTSLHVMHIGNGVTRRLGTKGKSYYYPTWSD